MNKSAYAHCTLPGLREFVASTGKRQGMIRAIKFRAWDTILEKMMDMKKIERSGMNLFALCEGVKIVTLMQFTGRRDRNGKDIYEGDITRDKHGCIGVIRYHRFWAGFYFHTVWGRNEDGAPVRMISSRNMYNDWDNLEVIGNEYEDPHLLEVIEQ